VFWGRDIPANDYPFPPGIQITKVQAIRGARQNGKGPFTQTRMDRNISLFQLRLVTGKHGAGAADGTPTGVGNGALQSELDEV
jgi:hypothetical protein